MLLAVGLVTGLSLLLLMRELSPLPFATFTLAERACIAAVSLSLHLFFSVVPFPGVMRFWFWDEPASLWWAWCAVGAAATGAAGVLWSLRRSRHVAAAAAWLAIALVPYLGFMDHHGLALSIAWPRHRYLASIAPLALVISGNVPGPRLPVNRERLIPAFVFHLHAVSAMLASCDGDGAHAARHRDAAAELFPEVSITGYLHPEDPHRCPVPPRG